jgi:hypothetical protein
MNRLNITISKQSKYAERLRGEGDRDWSDWSVARATADVSVPARGTVASER